MHEEDGKRTLFLTQNSNDFHVLKKKEFYELFHDICFLQTDFLVSMYSKNDGHIWQY